MSELERVRKVVSGVLRVPLESLNPDRRLNEIADLDSLSLVEIASALDDEFAIRLSSDGLSTVITIADLASLVAAAPRR